ARDAGCAQGVAAHGSAYRITLGSGRFVGGCFFSGVLFGFFLGCSLLLGSGFLLCGSFFFAGFFCGFFGFLFGRGLFSSCFLCSSVFGSGLLSGSFLRGDFGFLFGFGFFCLFFGSLFGRSFFLGFLSGFLFSLFLFHGG